MAPRIEQLADVVDAGLCCGCGACNANCEKAAVRMVNDEYIGIRPHFSGGCGDCRECLAFCPGAVLDYRSLRAENPGMYNPLLGPYLELYEGYAADKEIRFSASSGGVLSAIALYCLEQKDMKAVLHTGMDMEKPWLNRNVLSKSREEILRHTGSRYAPSSPCVNLEAMKGTKEMYVFIGKPCDAAAVYAMRRERKALNEQLGLSLSFFCAGPPVTKATLDFLAREGIKREAVNSIRYRGNGWPGEFEVWYNGNQDCKSYSYKQSWGALAKYRRPFRCSICPDGMGEFADISGGDAWHIYRDNGDAGQSAIIVRTLRGREILKGALNAGYLELHPSTPKRILSGQGLERRKNELHGRLLAMRLLALPRPNYGDFPGEELWRDNPLFSKFRTVAGTMRRILARHYMKRAHS